MPEKNPGKKTKKNSGPRVGNRLVPEGVKFVPKGKGGGGREAVWKSIPSVAEKIRTRKAGLTTEEERKKDEDRKENTPLQVVEKFRTIITDFQAARAMAAQAGDMMVAEEERFATLTDKEAKKESAANYLFYKNLWKDWMGKFNQRWAEAYGMQTDYGPALEAAHREYIGDFVQFVHFKKNHAALRAVQRSIARYEAPLLGVTGTGDEKRKQRNIILQGVIASQLAEEPAWTDEKFLEVVPEPGQEREFTAQGTNLLDSFALIYGPEKAAEMAKKMQDHFFAHDQPEIERFVQRKEGEADPLDVRGLSLADLKRKEEDLQALCEDEWENPAVRRMWFERFLQDIIVARLRGDKVLEMESTKKLLKKIEEIELSHPHTTIGVALVGDPGVGKTVVIEHYLRKQGRDYTYIDMTEEVTRYTLFGSPQTTIETQMDRLRRMSHDLGDLTEDDVKNLIKKSAANLEKGFGSLGEEEREVLALGMLQEHLEQADASRDSDYVDLLEREISQVNLEEEHSTEDAHRIAILRLKQRVEREDPGFDPLVQAEARKIGESRPELERGEIHLAAQSQVKNKIENAGVALGMDQNMRARLQKVRIAMAEVARGKYRAEVANQFADLTRKNGWRDGFVIHALRTNKSIIFDEFNGAKDWKLLHKLMTLKPGDEYEFGDKAGDVIKIPENWRMYFTGNIQVKHGGFELKEALVSRIGGAVIHVEPPPAFEEWVVMLSSISNAPGYPVRSEKDIVQLGFLVNQVFKLIRQKLHEVGSSEPIVPLSYRVIANISEGLMNHETQFARPITLDEVLLRELINPYLNYLGEKVADPASMPTSIAKLLLDAGMLLDPKVEDDVIKWTGISKEELKKKREDRKDKNFADLIKAWQEEAKDSITAVMPTT